MYAIDVATRHDSVQGHFKLQTHFKLQPVHCWKLGEAELILNSPSTQREFFFSFVLQCSTE